MAAHITKATQTIVVEGFDWGPAVTATVIDFGAAVAARTLDARARFACVTAARITSTTLPTRTASASSSTSAPSLTPTRATRRAGASPAIRATSR